MEWRLRKFVSPLLIVLSAFPLFAKSPNTGAISQIAGEHSASQDCNRAIPQPLNKLAPDFSRVSHKGPLHGTVTLGLRIGTDGSVKKAWIVSGIGREVGKRAIDAALASKWLPATKNCKSIEATLNLEVSLDLY